VSDRLAELAMLPEVREAILARTRGIIRANYPRLEEWLESHREIFTWARPDAGAIAYARADLPISSFELTERIRTERSVLLVPGDMFGLRKGLRLGFGYDIEHTMKGLSLVDEVLAEVTAAA
jgi:aspartate/methionine/tyrosine aminotransferase